MRLLAEEAAPAGMLMAPTEAERERWSAAIAHGLTPGAAAPVLTESFGGGSSEVIDGSDQEAGDLSDDELGAEAAALDDAVAQAESNLRSTDSSDWTTGIEPSMTGMTSEQLD